MVVSEDWYFLSHRFELAKFLREAGWEVIVATQVNRLVDAATIESAGLRLVPLPLERGRLLSAGDVRYFLSLRRLYRRERPTIVHHVAMKPVLYGSLAALGRPRMGVVNALAGLGYLFTASRGGARLVRQVVLGLFRRLFARSNTRVILQNAEDMALFRDRLSVPAENLRLVRGAGVDLRRFQPVRHGARDRVSVVLVARLLRDKGIFEFVAAAQQLRKEGLSARFLLVGDIDELNPNSLTRAEVDALRQNPAVELLGHRDDIPAIYSGADIAVLPSYREGLPKSLLEAAASGLPLVTTDTSGCREMVKDGDNGLLVPIRSVPPLADAIRRLVFDPALRARMGTRSRERAEQEFNQSLVLQQTLAVYEELAARRD
jgi:glycosyltransferase involved in cell wall biosynthesis